jgi:hypothetical protein
MIFSSTHFDIDAILRFTVPLDKGILLILSAASSPSTVDKTVANRVAFSGLNNFQRNVIRCFQTLLRNVADSLGPVIRIFGDERPKEVRGLVNRIGMFFHLIALEIRLLEGILRKFLVANQTQRFGHVNFDTEVKTVF